MPTTTVDNELLRRDPIEFQRMLVLAFEQLRSLSAFYPDFEIWYNQKILPGLKTGERSILLHHVGDEFAGVAVLKSAEEKKLCCLRVAPLFEGSGTGLRLFERSFDWLETDSPLLSVAEEQLPRFDKVFNHFGFERVQRYEDLYRPKKTEYSFNGVLEVRGR